VQQIGDSFQVRLLTAQTGLADLILTFSTGSASHLAEHCWANQVTTHPSAAKNYSSCWQIDARCKTTGGNHDPNDTAVESFCDHLALFHCKPYRKSAVKNHSA
jgi:hypothetical protein